MKRHILNLAAVIVMFAACKNEKQAVPVTTQPVSMAVLVSRISRPDPASNPSNPLDSIGAIHNKVLEVTWDYVQATGDTNLIGRRNQVIRYFRQCYGIETGTRLLQAEALFKKDYPAGQMFVPKNRVAPSVENYMNQIIVKIHEMTDASAYPAFKTGMVSMEKIILTDRSLTVIQQQQVLAVASIARYSVSYWLEKSNTIPPNDSLDKGLHHNFIISLGCSLVDVFGGINGATYGDSIREILEDASDESSLCSMTQ